MRLRWPYPRTPELGRDLPSNFDEGERMFDRRVKAQFPVGSLEAEVVDQLRRQGFRLNPAPPLDSCKSASIRQGFVIQKLWSVRWRATDARIDEIWGVYGAIAP